MQLYLSAVFQNKGSFKKFGGLENCIDLSKLHILQAFNTIKDEDVLLAEKCKDFLLDSGAFAVMNSNKSMKNFDIMSYTKKYAEFIKKYNIQDFIELDIDGVFGIDVYKDTLHMIQDITGREPIRVFHMRRGKEYYLELVKKFPRICIGGIAIKVIKENDFPMFTWFLEQAHNNNCKVHALGLSSLSNLRKYNFDSVDSASWVSSRRFNRIIKFRNHELYTYDGCQILKDNENFDFDSLGFQALQEYAKCSEYLDSF